MVRNSRHPASPGAGLPFKAVFFGTPETGHSGTGEIGDPTDLFYYAFTLCVHQWACFFSGVALYSVLLF